jgi:hypothetical protein
MPEPADDEKGLTRVQVPDRPTHIQASSGSTLLPAPVASLITFVAHSSSLSLRIGTTIGGLALDGARIGTLTGLELSRSAAEAILLRAGRDVTSVTSGNLGRAEAEGILERCVSNLFY